MQLFSEAERITALPLESQKIKVSTPKILGCQINESYAEDDHPLVHFLFAFWLMQFSRVYFSYLHVF